MARLYHPICVKASLKISIPLQWKGAMAHELYKMKGPMDRTSSYRDVALCDSCGKGFTGFLRECAKPPFQDHVLETQFGSGANSGNTEFAHLYLRCAFDIARSRGLCLVAVFIDVVTAFAAAVRVLALPSDGSWDSYQDKLRRFGFNDADIADIVADVQP
eukprot:10861661-Karenia_brevis.AAC.1